MILGLSIFILLTDSQFPVKTISMKSFFYNAIPKNIKKLKVFSSHLKSNQGESCKSCQNERACYFLV